jgi:hypothetical protein
MSDLRTRLQQRAPRRSTSSDDSGVSAVPSSARRGSSPSGDSDVTHRAVKYDGGPVTRSHFRSLTMEYEYSYVVSLSTYDYVTQKSRRSKQKPDFRSRSGDVFAFTSGAPDPSLPSAMQHASRSTTRNKRLRCVMQVIRSAHLPPTLKAAPGT